MIFQGGPAHPPPPPLDPHLKPQHKKAFHNTLNRYPNTKTTDMKQNTIKVKEPAIFFRENSAEPEKGCMKIYQKCRFKRKGVKKH